MTKQTTAVYAADRKTVLGQVTRQCTSIGAAKVANAPACKLSRVNGKYAWVACPQQ